RTQGTLDHHDILAVEKEFRLPVGPFTVLGYIDRVDRVDDETVEVLDYKTNRLLFTRDEVDSSLQMSLYHLAARQLWPWAKKVKLTFLMLRHGLRMTTERSPEQLEAAMRYVETVGRMTEEATEFPPRLNSNCVWCDHRSKCPAYAEALKGKRDFVCENTDDLPAVAREREEVARLVKILSDRKAELEGVLKTHLQEHDELVLAGTRYRMFNTAKTEYPLEPTVETIEKATGMERASLVARLAAVDKKALDALLKELAGRLDKPKLMLLKAELEAAATISYSPRFWAKAV
ncbi:MAG: PD-(D/E)XK nuclease family protein, partial [Deltaproteobacteria bacterium]|nr:PD-(D/E)XK nuclease family protein [Deltaproteobacteria bacterium]